MTQYQERRSTFLKSTTTKKPENDDKEDLLINYDDQVEQKNIVGIKDSLLKELYDSSSDFDKQETHPNPFFEIEVPHQTPKVDFPDHLLQYTFPIGPIHPRSSKNRLFKRNQISSTNVTKENVVFIQSYQKQQNIPAGSQKKIQIWINENHLNFYSK